MTIDHQPLALLIILFLTSAAVVWFGGWRLARHVAELTKVTGWGRAFTGMLLLGGITSLPEVAAVGTSAASGNAALAVNNLLGTASINILILALADVAYGRGALTVVAARPAILLQGVLVMLLATIVAMTVTVGDVPLFGVGAGSAILAACALAGLWLSSNYQHRHVWEVIDRPGHPPSPTADRRSLEGLESDRSGRERNLRRLVTRIALAGALILVGGFFLSLSADAISVQTGLTAGMAGFLLVGLSTSLPEISSITAAIKLRQHELAIGDIFGTNIFNIMLIFFADLVYRGGPVLQQAGRFEAIGSILAVIMTGNFIVGLLERENRTILRMGYDSLTAMLVFAAGLGLLARAAD